MITGLDKPPLRFGIGNDYWKNHSLRLANMQKFPQ
jgi:hypothetical protein